MMQLRIELLSDTTFGRGDGIAGSVDSEVEHDSKTGMPYVKGRTIKGILVESCADILYALQLSQSPALDTYLASAHKLFGQPGSRNEDTGCLHIGSARLKSDLQNRIYREVLVKEKYTPTQILEGMTTIRYQTAVNTQTNRPDDGSLRAIRAIVRQTVFYSDLVTHQSLSPEDTALLAASAAGMRRAGQSRSRGRGRIEVKLTDDHAQHLAYFTKTIKGSA